MLYKKWKILELLFEKKFGRSEQPGIDYMLYYKSSSCFNVMFLVTDKLHGENIWPFEWTQDI